MYVCVSFAIIKKNKEIDICSKALMIIQRGL